MPWADGPARWYERLFDQAVAIPSRSTDILGRAALANKVHLSTGVNEVSSGTLYNTLLWMGPGGEILGAHRKLVPTGGERLVWGSGDGPTL